MSTRIKLITCVIGAAAFAGPAAAQHADFVLFGDANLDGLNQPKEERFVHPITSPFFHEDSFVTSDVRAWFIYHDFPKSSLIDGGNGKAAAVQLRLALTERLQFVAYKDGYLDLDTGLLEDEGWFDVAAGLKYNLIQDWDNNFHLSVGAGYEFSIGDDDVLQDDDEFRLWTSVNKGFDRLHLGGTLNVFFADDKNDGLGNSDRLSWHLHADYYLCEWFSPVVEVNGYHVIDEGMEVVPFQGVDVANLGGGDGEDVVTLGLGAEFRPCDNLAFRTGYEMPLTDNDDLFGYRWTFSMVFSF